MEFINKRGIFFTTLILVILSLFLISYTFLSSVQDRKTTQKRVDTMNGFLASLERDIPRQMFTSGFRIIFLLEKRILEKGTYITNLDSVFEEAFFNGTIYGEANNETIMLMEGVIFSDILNSIQDKARKINVKFNFTDPAISISQDDPWNVKFTLVGNMTMEDESNIALWNKTWVIDSYIPIVGFEDPIYFVETSIDFPGVVFTNSINQTPYDVFVSGSDYSNLSDHAINSYYTNSSEAPSFLQRLQGLIDSQSDNGIESIVNTVALSGSGASVYDKSVVDHVYFSSSNPGAACAGYIGMPSWFKVDSGHRDIYQLTGC